MRVCEAFPPGDDSTASMSILLGHSQVKEEKNGQRLNNHPQHCNGL
jgi:hypothetical protein